MKALEVEQRQLRIGPCVLRAKTVNRVLPGNWLNDEIINAVVHVLDNR